MKSSWLVYRHTSPSGKVYIGITSKSNPDYRWGRGKGYKGSHGINIIRSFSSAKSAAMYYGKGKSTASHITECCKGKRNKVLNYKWMYKNG